MSTITSLNSTSSGYSSKGIGGLASGMDTDSLVEQMTAGTRGKIAKQKQQKQLLQWKSDSYRSITDKLIDFSQKFISLSSNNSLYRNSAFARSKVTVMGANSGAVSVTGSSTTAGNVSIAAIEQLARKAQQTVGNASDKKLDSTGVNTSGFHDQVSTLAGKTIRVTVPDGTNKDGSPKTKTYDVKLKTGDGYSYETLDDAVASINKSLSQVSVSSSSSSVSTLGDVVTFGKDGGKIKVSSNSNVSLKSNSVGLMDALGLDGTVQVSPTNSVTGNQDVVLKENVDLTFAEAVAGKEFTFTYNGTQKTVKLDDDVDASNFGSKLQSAMDRTFGSGRIKVNYSENGGSLSMETVNPDGTADNTSVLKFVNGDTKANTVLGLKSGESNRINQVTTIDKSGMDAKSKAYLTEMAQRAGLSADVISNSTVQKVIEKINGSNLGVTVSYADAADKLVMSANEEGASGEGTLNILKDIAQTAGYSSTDSDLTNIKGQDAIIHVKYAGSNDTVEIHRGSNTFDLEGLTVTANQTFGMVANPDGSNNLVVDSTAEEIKFDAKVDSEALSNSVKEMVTAYNELVDLVNSELKTKHDRDYPPLTDDQKEDMSEDEIKVWNEKAKKGMLNNDPDIRSLADSIRFIFSGSSLTTQELEDMGLTVSDDWADNGKITFDEEKFKEALDKDPEKVADFFASDATGTSQGGVMSRMKGVIDKYAGSTGVLVEKAGATSKPTSLLNNSLLKQMDDIDDVIATLQDRLKTEQDRYQSQFTQLEQLIASMNSQSSYLSSMFSS